MSAFAQPHVAIPPDYTEFLARAQSLIPDLELRQPPLESVAEYAVLNERLPTGFLRPDDHFVVADHMIDLPVIAIDLSSHSEHYGRVLAYSFGDYWVVADSLAELFSSMHQLQEAALFGRSEKT